MVVYLIVHNFNQYRNLQTHKFVIVDAPLLEYCDLHGIFVPYHFVKTPTTLIQARVEIWSQHLSDPIGGDGVSDNDEYRDKILQLFSGICWVKTLILTHWFGPLLCLLSKLDNVAAPLAFPHLISLKIQHDVDDQRDWPQIPRLPHCLLANVESLQVTQLMGTNVELKMLQHILSNAPVLAHLHVSVATYDNSPDSFENKDQLCKEYNFCRRLFMFPKSSQCCGISFSGVAITTSTKDFCDGVLTCQITHFD